MIEFEEIDDLFSAWTVWSDDRLEMFFYRWAWDLIVDKESFNYFKALVDAATLIYVYQELCYYICGENFYADLWDMIGEFAERTDLLPESERDRPCGLILSKDEDCPCDDTEAMQILVRSNHRRVVAALFEGSVIDVLTAFYASYANPQKAEIDKDGNEIEHDLIMSYYDFCRYVSDENFRNQEIGGSTRSEFQAAYDWIVHGAEMVET